MDRRLHDPYAPLEAAVADPRFRADRWVRAGADDEQLAILGARHAEMSVEQQTAEGDRVDSVADGDLTGELDHLRATAAERRHAAHPELEDAPTPPVPTEEAAPLEPEQPAPKRPRGRPRKTG